MQPDTWGTASSPEVAADQLNLDQYLAKVPQNGVVVDIGAGIGLSLEAAIQIRRPDLTIVAIDSGFRQLGSHKAYQSFLDELSETIDRVHTAERAKLETSTSWRNKLVAGDVEATPIRDEVADMVVSYSMVPEYSFDKDLTLRECLRVLKLGGIAVFGPTHDYKFEDWLRAVERVQAEGLIESHEAWHQTVNGSHDRVIEASFSAITK